MDSKSSSLDFAAIGHQESWEKIYDFVHSLRDKKNGELSMESIMETYSWIPPRKIFEVEIASTKTNQTSKGIYIETFISPEELSLKHYRTCIEKVISASHVAFKQKANIAALGGFTSIVLEGDMKVLNPSVNYTTGNTLTSAFIVKSVEKACAEKRLDLKRLKVLIIGSSGDIGSAVTSYLAPHVNSILLFARNQNKLKQQQHQISQLNSHTMIVENINNAINEADVIIAVASSKDVLKEIDISKPKIICDAGYPKNLSSINWNKGNLYYHGGMGLATGGIRFNNKISDSFYYFPLQNVIHGCLLEAIVLSFEKRYESFSYGSGNITQQKINDIYKMALDHGVTVAPFFNHLGLCQ